MGNLNRPGEAHPFNGWAQINGFRGITDTVDKMESRVKYDVYYAENWSLMFDLQILLGTVFVGFINKNAH